MSIRFCLTCGTVSPFIPELPHTLCPYCGEFTRLGHISTFRILENEYQTAHDEQHVIDESFEAAMTEPSEQLDTSYVNDMPSVQTMPDGNCVICESPYNDGDTVQLSCCHMFLHRDCLKNSLTYQPKCPFCNKVLNGIVP